MPRTNYQRGADFERKCLKELETMDDFVYAMRSAGSHSILDIVCFWWQRPPYFIQCSLRGKKSKEELDLLRDLAQECDAVPVLASQGTGQINFDILTVL